LFFSRHCQWASHSERQDSLILLILRLATPALSLTTRSRSGSLFVLRRDTLLGL
jgi:hypothetical protein